MRNIRLVAKQNVTSSNVRLWNSSHSVMEYPLQNLDLQEETEFLLGGSINHGGDDMEGGFAIHTRTPRKQKSIGRSLCW